MIWASTSQTLMCRQIIQGSLKPESVLLSENLGFFGSNKFLGIANIAHLWTIICVARVHMASFSEEKNMTQTVFRSLNFHRYLDHCVVTCIKLLLCARPWSGNRDTQMRCHNPVLMELKGSWGARAEKGRTQAELTARPESIPPEV